MASGEVFIISCNLSVKNEKTAKFKVIPDDCLQEILVNGKKFPLDGVQGLCDYTKGMHLDFSEYVKEGLNHFEFRIKNTGWAGGFRVKVPYNEFRSRPLILHIFILLFVFFILLTLKKIEVKLNKETIFACVFAFPFVIYAFVELCLRINYELTDVYNADTAIYWAIGRGIVNGIAPWSGLFETKPPGIFLVSAISFKIFDSPIFTNYFQAFVLLLTAATPAVAYFCLSNYRSVAKLVFSLLAGLMLALYSAERSDAVQVESFGVAFACITIFAMAVPDFEKRKILWITLAAIGILGACGFKEPFLFPLFGVSLIFCKDIKDWLWRFALPLVIAVLAGILLLLICGWFGDFLHYLSFMSSSHIFKYGSPLRRAMEFQRLYNDMNAFSWGLAIAVFALLSLPFVLRFTSSKPNENILFVKVIFFGIAFFLSSYSVGLGGEYWNHHHIFALPFYMALIILLLENWDGENFAASKLGLASFVFFAIAVLNLPNINLDERSESLNNDAKETMQVAAYLDLKMDELGIDRYTYIGGNGTQIYGWTKHSPMGPYFFQYDIWFGDIPGFKDSLVSNIKKSDAIVVTYMWNEIAWEAEQILREQFTEQRIKRYRLYFRKK
ncbi:hypothetical protein R83H12_02452 [Fibrobacteria bacterium R8-3-H12]